jgi:hypothetical protein
MCRSWDSRPSPTTGAEPSGPGSSRAVVLVAFLVVHAGSPQVGQRIADLFWPESTDAQASPALSCTWNPSSGPARSSDVAVGDHPGVRQTAPRALLEPLLSDYPHSPIGAGSGEGPLSSQRTADGR